MFVNITVFLPTSIQCNVGSNLLMYLYEGYVYMFALYMSTFVCNKMYDATL